MAPAPKISRGPDAPPSNSAQLGMGWNIATGTIDLGLALYDGLIMIGEWLRDYTKLLSRKRMKAEMQRKGRRPSTLHRRFIQIIQPSNDDLTSYANGI
jgi:hypothetical protein